MIKSHICVDLGEHSMVSNRHPKHSTLRSIVIYLSGLGFTKSEADVNLYHIVVDGKFLILILYVDDLILIGDEQLIRSCKGI